MSDEHQWVLIEQVNTARVEVGAEPTEVRSEGQPPEQGYWWIASLRYDGCVDLYKAANVPFCQWYGMPGDDKREVPSGGCDSSLHICEIQELRQLLQTLDVQGHEHFGEDWNT